MIPLKIDPEFRDKIPALTASEYKQLEENIVKDGKVISPLIVWGETIIDGHNRYSIVEKHPEIPFTIEQIDFADRYAAIVWICRNQLGRRNLSDEQKTYLIGKQYEAQKQTHGGGRGNQYTHLPSSQSGDLADRRTQDVIAKEHGIGGTTVGRAEKYAKGLDKADELSPGIKDAVLSGAVKAPKKVIASIPTMAEPEQKETVEAITEGKPLTPRQLGKLFDKITADFTDREVRPHTADDLKEELDAMIFDFTRKLKLSLDCHRTVLTGEEGIKKATAALKEAETAIEGLRRSITYG